MDEIYFRKQETLTVLIEYFQCSHISESFIKSVVEQIPAADVVEVVRCKDCFAYKKSIEFAEAANLNPDEFCVLLLIEMPPDGFCYYGKRRTEDG